MLIEMVYCTRHFTIAAKEWKYYGIFSMHDLWPDHLIFVANGNTYDDSNDDPITSNDNTSQSDSPDTLIPAHPQGCYYPSMAWSNPQSYTQDWWVVDKLSHCLKSFLNQNESWLFILDFVYP